MKRVLLTGMSGTGKTAVIRELAAVLANLREVEPRLRAVAGHEVGTPTRRSTRVVARVLRCAGV